MFLPLLIIGPLPPHTVHFPAPAARYYTGHKGKFGHEFLEFEFRPNGKLRYANNSQYKNDTMIRKECVVAPEVM